MNDQLRTAIMTFVRSIFPVLIFVGLVSLTDSQVAAIMVAIEAGLTLLALTFKQGQQLGTPLTTDGIVASVEKLDTKERARLMQALRVVPLES